MKHIIALITALQLWHFSFAQYENVWIFGNNAGIDFNSGTPVPVRSNITGFGEAAASVCDAGGQLLFYTEGDMVWNKNHELMPNGKKLTGLRNDGSLPTSSSSQGALIVPMPGSTHKYYIFSLSCNELYKPAPFDSTGRLYYSIVDMNLNGGLGDVEAGKKGVLIETNLTELMTSATGTRCNVWVIVPSRNPSNLPEFKAFEITESGLSLSPVISTTEGNAQGSIIGKIAMSHNSKRLAVTRTARSGASIDGPPIELYDFDRATGKIANPVVLGRRNMRDAAFYGACFSKDNSKLYVNLRSLAGRQSGIFQYNLDKDSIESIIESYTFIDSAFFTDIKRGGDGKIYYIADEGKKRLGIIHYPDSAGLACRPQHNGIQLPDVVKVHGGLPNTISSFTRDTSIAANKL